MGNSLFFKIFQVVVNSIKCEIDGIFAFVVHADTDEDFDLEGSLFHAINHLWAVHLSELVDEPILEGEGSEISGIGTLLI